MPLSAPDVAHEPHLDSRRLLEESAQLLESASNPAEFQAEFLQRVVRGLAARGGALWECTAEGQFRPLHERHLAELDLDPAAHAELLQAACQRERAWWTGGPAGGRSAGLALLLAPLRVDRQTVGVLEVWLPPPEDQQTRRNLARLLTELSGIAAAFHHRHEWRDLVQRQKLWAKLEAFARHIHGSLDPQAVAAAIANQARPLVECDQVSVAVRLGRKVKVQAISGAPIVEKRSTLVQAMQALFQAIMAWGEKLVFGGIRDQTLPPNVLSALDAYLKESNSRLLVVLPLRDDREKDQSGPCTSALMAETFQPTGPPEPLVQRLEIVAHHAAPALYNAAQYRRLPLQWLTRPLSGLQESLRARGPGKLGFILLLVLVAAGILSLVPASLRLEAKGQLVPVQRQVVFARLAGRIVDLKVQPGDVVEKGQELLFVEDLETQLQSDQLSLKIGAAEARLALLQEQLSKPLSKDERHGLTKERIQQEYELRKAVVEREILQQGNRSPRKAAVTAPLAGKVVTFDAQEQLLGKSVKPGDPLLRLARVKGTWEIELFLPESRLAAIREALERCPAGYLDVDFMLASHPQRTFRGRLHKDGLGGETVVRDNQVVLPARVRLSDPELLQQVESMPVGVEVRAKVNCGSRSVGYVWFNDLWEFFYEHVLF